MKKNKKPSGWKFAFSYLKRYKFTLAVYIFAYLLVSVLGLWLSIETANFLTNLADADAGKAFYTLFAVIAIAIGSQVVTYGIDMIYFIVTTRIALAIKADLSARVLQIDSSVLDSVESGVIISRIDKDPEDMINSLDAVVYQASEVVRRLLTIVYISIISWVLGIVVIVAVGCMVLLELLRVKIYQKNLKKQKKFSEPATSITAEMVRSQKDIKTLGLKNQIYDKFYMHYSNYKKASRKTGVINFTFYDGIRVVTDVVIYGLSFLALYLLGEGLLAIAGVIYIFSNSASITGMVSFFGYMAQNLTEFKVSADRIYEMYDEEKYPLEKFGDKNIAHLKGSITFKNVGFYYTEKRKIEESTDKKIKKNATPQYEYIKHNVFDNLNFEVKPNTTVAFIGASGSGKSTIMNLIAKLNNATSGQVLLDGEDITTLSENTLRDNMILVNQFPYIYDMTIRENVLLAKPNASLAEVENALKDANLWEYVQNLPNGVDTKIGENGVKMSGGEKQRLAIARALIKNTPIIIFDESTSSLDNISQALVTKAIQKLSGKHTVVIVAHRLSTIKNVDTIYFLEKGEIIDQGTFDELNLRNQKFNNLFRAENLEAELAELKGQSDMGENKVE